MQEVTLLGMVAYSYRVQEDNSTSVQDPGMCVGAGSCGHSLETMNMIRCQPVGKPCIVVSMELTMHYIM